MIFEIEYIKNENPQKDEFEAENQEAADEYVEENYIEGEDYDLETTPDVHPKKPPAGK